MHIYIHKYTYVCNLQTMRTILNCSSFCNNAILWRNVVRVEFMEINRLYCRCWKCNPDSVIRVYFKLDIDIYANCNLFFRSSKFCFIFFLLYKIVHLTNMLAATLTYPPPSFASKKQLL